MIKIDKEKREELLLRRERLKSDLCRKAQYEERKELIEILEAEKRDYKILWTEVSVQCPMVKWLNDNFEIAFWGRIDWSKIPEAIVENTLFDYSKAAERFESLITEQKLGDPVVIVFWSNANSMSIELKLSDVARHATLFFKQDWDTWIICKEKRWSIEHYHEGELAFGYASK